MVQKLVSFFIKYICTLAFCAGANFLAAQEPVKEFDNDNYSSVPYTDINLLDQGIDSLSHLDSSLDHFHLYNPLFRHNFGLGDLGNAGTAVQPTVFNVSREHGFDPGWHYYDPYLLSVRDRANRYYKIQRALTRLSYTQGATELMNLKAMHTQNIRSNWNMGVDFNRLKSNGFYLRQNTSVYNTRLFNFYHTRDHRYFIVADAVFNRVKNQESGGILSQTAFDTLDGAVRTAMVHFFGTGQVEARNHIRSNEYNVRQYFRLGRDYHFPTEAIDSTGRAIPDSVPTLIPGAQLMLNTGYRTYRNVFTINSLEELGYVNFYRDSFATYDSFAMREGWVEFALQSAPYKTRVDSFYGQKKLYSYELGFRYQGINAGWQEDYVMYHNMAGFGRLGLTNHNGRKLDVSYLRYFKGYNNGDEKLEIAARMKLHKNIDLWGELMQKNSRPEFNSYYFFSNQYFWWNQNIERIHNTVWQLGISSRHAWIPDVSAAMFTISGQVYFDTSGKPQQYTPAINVIQYKLEKKFRYKKFNFYNRLVFQETDKASIIRLPKIAYQSGLYAEGHMFKRALFAKIGVDFFYTSSYKANQWNPHTRQFQFQDSLSVGNYPYFNVYFTGRIRTFTFYVMFQHVSMGLFGDHFYASPLYPMEPRALRFGVEWYLYN